MAGETIFQNFIFKDFMLPFVFMFVLVFAILQKTKILGKDKKQLDAIVSGVVALIFVSVAYPKMIVGNLILILTVAIVLIFVGLLIWGFLVGDEAKLSFGESKWLKWVVGILIVIFVALAFFWSAGINPQVIEWLFGQTWSNTFWTNLAFIVVIAVVMAVVIKSKEGGK